MSALVAFCVLVCTSSAAECLDGSRASQDSSDDLSLLQHSFTAAKAGINASLAAIGRNGVLLSGALDHLEQARQQLKGIMTGTPGSFAEMPPRSGLDTYQPLCDKNRRCAFGDHPTWSAGQEYCRSTSPARALYGTNCMLDPNTISRQADKFQGKTGLQLRPHHKYYSCSKEGRNDIIDQIRYDSYNKGKPKSYPQMERAVMELLFSHCYCC
ncbi:unnamed protein product [Vitrella brassicaformis CCMP3155]|uniref:Uncharacterized protein n=2 Tax=Vitrella brassicaformis TaxID=1169539 RepID=A0A0G4G2M9_VITBC|nr:unnamed protein product [Vitrella brassicaformis CCMP3155]|mmetsp:Transcript_44699/g.111161  ORF Transcript_44699/g.111161 Transcript_44699/m.111161 type:complete len:212 (+) Transcript_44699:36-671(+)|eukprot:CEM22523.1 unnamed protein product [Vitrella brassicaformis CCMP3155]